MDRDELKYATVHFAVRQKLDISWGEYILLDMVYHLSAKYGFCFKTMAGIAADLGQSFNGTKSMVQRLIDRELIVQDKRGLQVTQAYIDAAYYDKTGAIAKIAMPKSNNRGQLRKSQSIAKTAIKLRKSQSIAKTSDKNNNINTLELNTNVLAKPDKRKPEVNQMFDYWQVTVGYKIEGRIKPNRNACSNLLKKYGPEKLKQLISGVALVQSDPYGPRISDFSSLQAKQNDLIAWGRRKQTEVSADKGVVL